MSAVSHLANLKSAFLIQPVIQHYAWGKKGEQSLAGKLSGQGSLAPQEPFAELWYGAHLKAPSLAHLKTGEVPLNSIISSDPERVLGASVAKRFNDKLPFLFKVLSVARPLSIQLHPDSKTAAQLHAKLPEQYPDDSHKPELAIAVTPVELLCGFRPLEEIAQLVQQFKAVLPGAAAFDNTQQSLQQLLRRIFQAAPDERARTVQSIARDLAQHRDPNAEWFRKTLELTEPSDPGLVLVLLMQHAVLEPGEATFIYPNLPHAYLSGDLLECMASSDNVVRAGLTPKFIDVESFLATVDVTAMDTIELKGRRSGNAVHFVPPVPEFQVAHYNGDVRCEPLPSSTVSIVVCIAGTVSIKGASGSELTITPGQGALNPADTTSTFSIEGGTAVVVSPQPT